MTPDQETKHLKDVDRGARAQRILNDELVVDALAKIRSAIFQRWQDCSVKDTESQIELKHLLTVLTNFETYFRRAISSGEFSANELEKARTMKEKMRRAARGIGIRG